MAKIEGPKLSIYIPEELKTRFKLACTAKKVSMNQIVVDFIEKWTEENDPFKQTPTTEPGKNSNGKGRRKKKSESETTD